MNDFEPPELDEQDTEAFDPDEAITHLYSQRRNKQSQIPVEKRVKIIDSKVICPPPNPKSDSQLPKSKIKITDKGNNIPGKINKNGIKVFIYICI